MCTYLHNIQLFIGTILYKAKYEFCKSIALIEYICCVYLLVNTYINHHYNMYKKIKYVKIIVFKISLCLHEFAHDLSAKSS